MNGGAPSMFVTLLVSQRLRSWLNVAAAVLHDEEHIEDVHPQNRYRMLVTRLVSHPPIAPYVAVAAAGLASHASRAA